MSAGAAIAMLAAAWLGVSLAGFVALARVRDRGGARVRGGNGGRDVS